MEKGSKGGSKEIKKERMENERRKEGKGKWKHPEHTCSLAILQTLCPHVAYVFLYRGPLLLAADRESKRMF